MRVDDSRLPVVRLTLAFTEKRNRLDTDSVGAILATLDAAEQAPGASVLVIDAEGDDFCSGMDLDPPRDDWRQLVEGIHELLSRLRRSPLVTVAVVQGAATGGGVGLAAACDLVLAGPAAEFRMTEVLLGLVPAMILPLVAARVGRRKALALALLAEPVPGPEAARIGLADACGDEPERELARVLRRLRAADAAAATSLKKYALALAEHEEPRADLAWAVLEERLSNPETRERLAWLRTARPTT